jgi:hypothetical protein
LTKAVFGSAPEVKSQPVIANFDFQKFYERVANSLTAVPAVFF